MSKPIQTISPQAPLADIMKKMYQFGLHALPVVDEQGKTQGLVTQVNIFEAILKLTDPQDPSTPENVSHDQYVSEDPAVSESTQSATKTI